MIDVVGATARIGIVCMCSRSCRAAAIPAAVISLSFSSCHMCLKVSICTGTGILHKHRQPQYKFFDTTVCLHTEMPRRAAAGGNTLLEDMHSFKRRACKTHNCPNYVALSD